MDFEITPAFEGISVEARFYVETWDELAALMNRLEDIEEITEDIEEMFEAAGAI